MDVAISTSPFAAMSQDPIARLEEHGFSYRVNALGRRLRAEEVADFVGDAQVLIAGTEPINRKAMEQCQELRLISRVGIGLDSVDLKAARDLGISVAYTPDAPAPAVAELTIGLAISVLRATHVADAEIRRGDWNRHMGRRLGNSTIGIVGAGRVGSRVAKFAKALGSPRILILDPAPSHEISRDPQYELVDKDQLLSESDVVTLHVPLTHETRGLIRRAEIELMKPTAVLVNTSRGGVVDEHELAEALIKGHLAGAAIDVFVEEPYAGPLASIENCLLTSHLGSMSADCRNQMEIEATHDAVSFLLNRPLRSPVPASEYENSLF